MHFKFNKKKSMKLNNNISRKNPTNYRTKFFLLCFPDLPTAIQKVAHSHLRRIMFNSFFFCTKAISLHLKCIRKYSNRQSRIYILAITHLCRTKSRDQKYMRSNWFDAGFLFSDLRAKCHKPNHRNVKYTIWKRNMRRKNHNNT